MNDGGVFTMVVEIPIDTIHRVVQEAITVEFAVVDRFGGGRRGGDARIAVERRVHALLQEVIAQIDLVGLVGAVVSARLPGIIEEVTCAELTKRVARVAKQMGKRGELLPTEGKN